MEKFAEFAEFCKEHGRRCQHYELEAHLRAHCCLRMWLDLTAAPDASKAFSQWCVSACCWIAFATKKEGGEARRVTDAV